MANGMAGTSPTTAGGVRVGRNVNPQTGQPYKNTIADLRAMQRSGGQLNEMQLNRLQNAPEYKNTLGDLRAMQRSGQELSPFQMNRLENAPGQGNLERVSPGVYRNQQGQLVNPQGQLMPEQPRQPQMPMQTQPYGPPMGMAQGLAQGLGNYLQQNPGYIFNKPNSNNFNVDMSQMQPYGSPQFANQPMMRPAVMPNYNPMMANRLFNQNK